jgi:AraC-like DNA-binding protein
MEPHHRPGTVESHARAVERVIDAMNTRMDDTFTLDQMASIAIMSRFHFNRTFRRVTGVPPRHFLGALRLEAARRLLVTTSASVTDVCFSVGYNSLGTFIRRFTGLLGVSPRRLRVLASRLDSLPSPAPASTTAGQSRRLISGRVEAPPGFQGLIFIGLFRSALPQEVPVACAIARASGAFTMKAPSGTFHLFSLAISATADRAGYFLYDSALRAGGQVVTVTPDQISGSTDLRLRTALPTDPPILLALPVLLRKAARSPQLKMTLES